MKGGRDPQNAFFRRDGLGPLQLPESQASRAVGAVLRQMQALKSLAGNTRSCAVMRRNFGSTTSELKLRTAARRSVQKDATAPRNPPRAAKISYLKIDRYLCSYVAETGRQTKRPPRERQPESPLSTGRPWRPDSRLWWRESARAYSPAPRSENGDRAPKKEFSYRSGRGPLQFL